MIIRKYFEVNGQTNRKNVIIPDSAHGTNPASAAMCGFDVISIKSGEDGLIDISELKKVLDVVEPKYSNKISFQKINTGRIDRKTAKEIEKYEVKVVPTLIFLDKDGNTVYKTEGSMSQEVLCSYLDRLIK